MKMVEFTYNYRDIISDDQTSEDTH
jgi:hypothetical protein